MTIIREQCFKCPEGILTNIVQVISVFLQELETNISEYRCFHENKRFWPFFLRIIDSDNPQGTIYKCPQGNMTFTVEVLRLFHLRLTGC